MKSGNIVLIGPTNSGKSSLVNKIMGQRVSLVSRKKQSTTFNQKVYKKFSENEFIIQDTPGFFSSRKKINNNIISSPLAEIETSDLIYVVLDISLRINNEYKKIINSLENKIEKQQVFLILNKIDKVKKDKVLNAIKFYSKEKIFNEIFPISSLTGEGVANLIKFSKKFTIKTSIKSKSSSNIQIKRTVSYTHLTLPTILLV